MLSGSLSGSPFTGMFYGLTILDTETGTLNFHDKDLRGDIAPAIVYPFED